MSTTLGIFSRFERDELNKITAKSILEKLMNIRQNINVEFTARRLVWELIQNAKDNASLCNSDNEVVDVKIELTENEFIFSHNKGYFTNEHIRGLIRKYSSSDKDRDVEKPLKTYKTTGRFGTGFMTTHLLSEKVQVKSYYRNDEETFTHFNFWLDRSGKSEAQIIEGINNSFEETEANLQKSEAVKLAKDDFKTSFIYPLVASKKTLAYIALDEVRKGVAYTLINVQGINSITLIEPLIEETIYKVELIDMLVYEGRNLNIYNLLVNKKSSESYYLTIDDDNVRITIPISYEKPDYYSLELEPSIPRLHLDFPMIGTEDLNLPFIINSPLFEPTEPRDGVSLINDEDNETSQINCNIVLKAVRLYNELLSYVGSDTKWNDLYNLARIKPPQKHPWIDYEWFKDNVVDAIRGKLLYVPIVDVVNGDRNSIWNAYGDANVFFPYAEHKNVREKIWELSKRLYPQFVPLKKHIDKWNEVLWSDCSKFSISSLSEEIQSHATLEGLANSLRKEEGSAINFLNDYYNLLNLEGKHIKDIVADEYAVIPNKLGEFIKKSELSLEKDIDEELMNACSLVSRDPREYLLYKGVFTGEGILYHTKKRDDIINEINNIIKEGDHDGIANLCDYLASLFPTDVSLPKRESIYEFSKVVFPNDFTVKRSLIHNDERIWEESDKKSIFYIVSTIADYGIVEVARRELGFSTESEFIKWLDTLITFVVKEGFQNNINREKHPILPNQNGVFCTKDNLFLDDGDIDDNLKDIANELGHDFRAELLNKSIFLELPENRTYGIANVAEKISAVIKPIIRDVDQRKVYKTTLKDFYLWMNKNKESANIHFSDLFEKRFLFLEDDDISLNMKKATEFDQLLEEHGIESIDDLRVKLASLNVKSEDVSEPHAEKINITKEILVSLGISSQEQLEEAFRDPAISSEFYHTSSPTTEMFIYVQGLIQRAKQNIIEYLENHPDYNCDDLEETAPTILAGIVKNGVSIHVVVRPSDNGEVIIYYSSEKDTLDSDNAELWVDNGIVDPHILTLGRILKSTGINRIPIIMN